LKSNTKSLSRAKNPNEARNLHEKTKYLSFFIERIEKMSKHCSTQSLCCECESSNLQAHPKRLATYNHHPHPLQSYYCRACRSDVIKCMACGETGRDWFYTRSENLPSGWGEKETRAFCPDCVWERDE
jgi:hypothetical protein